MYDITSAYLQSELNYRAERIKSGVAVRRPRRYPWVRRPVQAGNAR
jgi:hypothetical protein